MLLDSQIATVSSIINDCSCVLHKKIFDIKSQRFYLCYPVLKITEMICDLSVNGSCDMITSADNPVFYMFIYNDKDVCLKGYCVRFIETSRLYESYVYSYCF